MINLNVRVKFTILEIFLFCLLTTLERFGYISGTPLTIAWLADGALVVMLIGYGLLDLLRREPFGMDD